MLNATSAEISPLKNSTEERKQSWQIRFRWKEASWKKQKNVDFLSTTRQHKRRSDRMSDSANRRNQLSSQAFQPWNLAYKAGAKSPYEWIVSSSKYFSAGLQSSTVCQTIPARETWMDGSLVKTEIRKLCNKRALIIQKRSLENTWRKRILLSSGLGCDLRWRLENENVIRHNKFCQFSFVFF